MVKYPVKTGRLYKTMNSQNLTLRFGSQSTLVTGKSVGNFSEIPNPTDSVYRSRNIIHYLTGQGNSGEMVLA